MTITRSEARRIFEKADAAATQAKLDFFLNGGREAGFNCGFAWVEVHPARGNFVNWCKAQTGHKYGSKGYPKGWHFWGPGEWPTAEQAGVPQMYGQDMDVNYAGATAFAKVLREHGLDAVTRTRLD